MATNVETNAEVAKNASSTQWRLKASRNPKTVVARKNSKTRIDEQKSESPQSTDEECKTFQDEAPRNDKDHHSEEFKAGSESGETGEEPVRRRSSYDKREAAKHYKMPPRESGVVVKFSPQRGYGFIRPDCDYSITGRGQKLPDVFVHRTSIVSTSKVPNLRVGQSTEYDVTMDQRTGKPHAVNVTVTNPIPQEVSPDMKSINRQGERKAFALRKKGKQWSSNASRKMGRINAPIKSMPNQPFLPKGQHPDTWGRSRIFDEKKSPRNAWSASEDRMDFGKDMNMTVTIDNELPKNAACYSYRSESMQPSWPPYHQDYPHQMNYHHDLNHPQNYVNHPNGGYDCAAMGPPRKNLREYDDYARREYWYCDQEKHMAQYNNDYRNSMAYNMHDYRQYPGREGYRSNQQW